MTMPDPGQLFALGGPPTIGGNAADIGAERCVLVVIWTRTRLGLAGRER